MSDDEGLSYDHLLGCNDLMQKVLQQMTEANRLVISRLNASGTISELQASILNEWRRSYQQIMTEWHATLDRLDAEHVRDSRSDPPRPERTVP